MWLHAGNALVSSASLPGADLTVWVEGCGRAWPANAASLNTGGWKDLSVVISKKGFYFFFWIKNKTKIQNVIFNHTCIYFLPPVCFQLMKSLGVDESCRFVDVVGLESDPLSAVPKPCCALMLLFPLTQQVTVLIVIGWGAYITMWSPRKLLPIALR